MATKKLKKLIINGESYNLPNNSDFVDLSSAQSVGGVKTFTSAPVVPSKTSSATNTGTAVATEAQVYAKQDKLVSGTNIKTVNNNSLVGSGNVSLSEFTPGNSGTTGQVIMKTASGYEWSDEVGQVYTAGANVQISNSNVISATDTTYPTVSKSDMDTGTSTTVGVVSAKDVSDFVKGKLTNVYVYKGTKSTYGDLPSSGNVVGDVWNVETAHTTAPKFPAGSNLAWDGTAWDVLGGTFDTSNFVDTSSAQTVGGVKTFTSEPVLPSKSTSAGNNATKPATEAQVYLKQDKLTQGSNIQITTSGGTTTISATDTTYESKSASSGGTAVSLVTTGEKYTWNNKADTSDIGNATISFTQGGTSIGSMTANQSSNGSLAFHDNIPVTQSAYDDLPSSKATDGNSYWIYETVS